MKGNRVFSRRKFLPSTGGAVAWTIGYTPALLSAQSQPARPRFQKRIALLATEVRKYSHAQHFVDRFLEGYGWQGRHHYPPIELAALYVDQVPEGDLSRDRAKRHGVRI